MAQFREFYRKEVVPTLTKQFGYSNPMRVPKVTKVVLNMGVGEALTDKKVLEHAANDLSLISGQKVVITKARKSIANFKIREGWSIGCKVTLRGERMYEFLERLVGIAIPRIRDFRGLSPKSFDGRGNFAMGVNEQIIFPEIDYDKIDTLRGLNITITTSAQNDDEGRALLTALHFPFRKPAAAAPKAEAATATETEETSEAAPAVAEDPPTDDKARASADEITAIKADVVDEEASAPEQNNADETPEAEEQVPVADATPAAKDKEESKDG